MTTVLAIHATLGQRDIPSKSFVVTDSHASILRLAESITRDKIRQVFPGLHICILVAVKYCPSPFHCLKQPQGPSLQNGYSRTGG